MKAIFILPILFVVTICEAQQKKPLSPYDYVYKIDSIPLIIKRGYLKPITGKQRKDYDERWIDSVWLNPDRTLMIYKYRAGEFYELIHPHY